MVVVGDFVADEYVYGETDRVNREAPVLVVRYESSELKPGGAGNAAQNLAALGVKVRAVGAAARTPSASALLDELEEAGDGRLGDRSARRARRPRRRPASSRAAAPPAASR